jgi:hypothetical protein
MTPKEKAEELFKKMYQVRSVAGSDITKYFAKQSALVAVDEIMNYITTSLDIQTSLAAVNYWEEVKQEIQEL